MLSGNGKGNKTMSKLYEWIVKDDLRTRVSIILMYFATFLFSIFSLTGLITLLIWIYEAKL